ncbi:MAG TPA: glycosyltransferase family 39 protein [Thermoleophilaceae bacterium]|nr:glycosyltransferase family 39 protein [Thermoleophilaceae bacterium]
MPRRAPGAPGLRARLERAASTRAAPIAAFIGLLLVSLAFKARGLGSAYWIDEGLSVGIGSHPLFDIPGLLVQDGSPPLYYMLLHVWMSWFGTSELATQSLSAVFGLLCVPAAFWAGNVVSGRRVAWAAATLAAVNPFLTLHAYEARMYALEILLGILTSTAFVLAYVQRRPRWRPAFGVLLALMLYNHNWGLFFGVACALALAWLWRTAPAGKRRGLLRDGAIGFGVAAVLYAPWVPTLLSQARHTGAPWSTRPMFDELIFGTGTTIGGRGPSVALALAAGVAISGMAAHRRVRELRTAQVLLILFAGAVLVAFVASQISPAWASRYLAVSLGPLLLFAAVTLCNADRLGMWALAIFVVICALPQPVHRTDPSDEKVVAEKVKPAMRPGDLVILTHPERVPIMHHYLGPQFRYADLFGPVKDPRIMDWRDALERMKTVSIKTKLDPLLASVPLHGHVMLVRPIVDKKANSWDAPWTHRVNIFSVHWARALNHDPRFRPVKAAPFPWASLRYGVRAVVYQRVR